MYSYVYPGSQEIWEQIFHEREFLSQYREIGIYFTLLGCFGSPVDKPYLSLVVTKDSNVRLNILAWKIFLESLRKPYTYDEKRFEITFDGLDVTLNIYGFLHYIISGNAPKKIIGEAKRLVYDYYKSETMLTFSTGACTYGEDPDWDPSFLSPGPIRRTGNSGRYYTINLKIAGQERQLKLSS